MARSTYLGTANDLIWGSAGPGASPRVPSKDVTLTFWDAQTGGARHTDLLLDGAPVTEVVIAAADLPGTPAIQGPDGVNDGMWVQAQIAGATATDRRELVLPRVTPADIPNPTPEAIGAETPAGAQAKVDAGLAALKGSAPAAYDTLVEIASKLDADDDVTATILADLGDKVDVADLDVQSAAVVADPASDTRAALNGAIDQQVNTPGTPTHDGLSATFARGDVVNDAAALPLLGSKRTGNLTLGAGTRALADTTQHNAFPGLTACADGSLLSVWRQAANHEPTAVGVIRARKSTDKGLTWGASYTIASDVLDLRDPNLTALSDGTLVLQCFKHDGANGEGVYLATSTDNGATFGALSKVPFTFTLTTSSSSRVVELTDGAWVVAAYGKNTGAGASSARTIKTTDRGATWAAEVTIATGTRSYEEPYIGIRPDGKLMAVIRTSDNVLYKAESADGGATWGGLNRADGGLGTLANSGGRPAWVAIPSYGILLTYRHMVAPYPLRFVTSWDNGGTWSSSTQLGTTPANQSVYAQPVVVARGLIAAAYAIEESLTSARVDFAYLLDGNGVSPLGDTNPPPGAGGGGIAKEYLKLRKSADQALVANTYTAITWDIEKNDSWGGHSGTSADFTVDETGLYFFAPRVQTGYNVDISVRLIDTSSPSNPLLQDFRKANVPNTVLSTGVAWLEVGKTYQVLVNFSADGQVLGGDFAYRTELTVAKIKGS